MASITQYVGASGHDCYEVSPSGFSLAGLSLRLGAIAGQNDVGLYFDDIAIPQGSNILSAVLTLYYGAGGRPPTSAIVKGVAADDAAVWSTGNRPSGTSKTTASVAWVVGTEGETSTVDVPVASPDLSTIIQEIVNRSGFVSGNAIALVVESDDLTNYTVFRSYDYNDPALYAMIEIEYMEPVELSASGGGISGASADMRVVKELAASGGGVSGASAELLVEKLLSASGGGVSGASATLLVEKLLSASGGGVSGASARFGGGPSAAFLAESAKSGNRPVTLLVFHFPAPTGDVRISDRALTVGGNVYLPLVTAWSPVYNRADAGLLTFPVRQSGVTVAWDEAAPFPTLFRTHNPLEVIVDMYHWFEGLPADDTLLVHSFVCTKVHPAGGEEQAIELESLMRKYDRPIGTEISKTNWPYADPDAIGRIEPLVYGPAKNVVCPCVVGGGYSTLAQDITATATKAYPSLSPNQAAFPTSFPFTLMLEKEQTTATSSGTDATGFYFNVTRASGENKVPHMKGSVCYQETPTKFLACSEPVSALGDVRVNGVKVLSGVTKRTDDSGKATVEFATRFTLEKAVSLSASDTPHAHGLGYNETPMRAKSVAAGAAYGWTQSGNKDNISDGIDTSMFGVATSGSPSSGSIILSFDPWNGAPPLSVKAHIRYYWYSQHAPDSSHYFKLNGVTLPTASPGIEVNTVDLGTSVPSSLTLTYYNTTNTSDIDIYEVWLVVKTDSTATASANISLSGNSAADILVGGTVTCDVDGMVFSGSMAENPADVAMHAALELADCPAGYVPLANFSSARAALNGKGYVFAGVVTRQMKLSDFLAEVGFQSRCRIFERAGELRMRFRRDTAGPSVKSFGRQQIQMRGIKAGPTDDTEIINDMAAHYEMDWSKGHPSPEACMSLCDDTTAFPKGGDTTSVGKNGLKKEEVVFWLVTLKAMMESIRDFYLGRYKDVGERVIMSAWEAEEIQEYDIIDLTHDGARYGYSGQKVEVESADYYPGSGKSGRPHLVEITGVTTS